MWKDCWNKAVRAKKTAWIAGDVGWLPTWPVRRRREWRRWERWWTSCSRWMERWSGGSVWRNAPQEPRQADRMKTGRTAGWRRCWASIQRHYQTDWCFFLRDSAECWWRWRWGRGCDPATSRNWPSSSSSWPAGNAEKWATSPERDSVGEVTTASHGLAFRFRNNSIRRRWPRTSPQPSWSTGTSDWRAPVPSRWVKWPQSKFQPPIQPTSVGKCFHLRQTSIQRCSWPAVKYRNNDAAIGNQWSRDALSSAPATLGWVPPFEWADSHPPTASECPTSVRKKRGKTCYTKGRKREKPESMSIIIRVPFPSSKIQQKKTTRIKQKNGWKRTRTFDPLF